VRRTVRLVIALFVLAGIAAPTTFAAQRMWVGFHDDPSFRWNADRDANVASASQSNATIMRLLVQWNLAAKTKPANATDPFDPAYEFDDVDEAVRTAQQNDQEVILTITGTPRWANGGKSQNVVPTQVSDFGAFARAIASISDLALPLEEVVKRDFAGLDNAAAAVKKLERTLKTELVSTLGVTLTFSSVDGD